MTTPKKEPKPEDVIGKGAELDLNQIQRQLQIANRQVAERCWAEIEQVCQRNRCNLVAVPQIGEDGRIVAMIRVIPVPPDRELSG